MLCQAGFSPELGSRFPSCAPACQAARSTFRKSRLRRALDGPACRRTPMLLLRSRWRGLGKESTQSCRGSVRVKIAISLAYTKVVLLKVRIIAQSLYSVRATRASRMINSKVVVPRRGCDHLERPECALGADVRAYKDFPHSIIAATAGFPPASRLQQV